MVLIKGFIDKFQYIINLIKGFTSLIRLEQSCPWFLGFFFNIGYSMQTVLSLVS